MFVVFSQRLDDEVGRERGPVIVERSFPQERYYKLVTDYATFQQRCRAFFARVFTPLFFSFVADRTRTPTGLSLLSKSFKRWKLTVVFFLPRSVGRIIFVFCMSRERERENIARRWKLRLWFYLERIDFDVYRVMRIYVFCSDCSMAQY